MIVRFRLVTVVPIFAVTGTVHVTIAFPLATTVVLVLVLFTVGRYVWWVWIVPKLSPLPR